jgi:hypothetical protein
MKAMKGMNRMLGSIKRKRKQTPALPGKGASINQHTAQSPEAVVDNGLDTPEANAIRSVVCGKKEIHTVKRG